MAKSKENSLNKKIKRAVVNFTPLYYFLRSEIRRPAGPNQTRIHAAF